MRRVANENINPMIAPRETGGYQGYGAPSEEELLAAMSAKEGNYSPTQPQSVPDSYNMDSLDRDRELLYAMQAGALDSSPTTLAGGLSRLGQAWLARGANKDITAREDEMRAAEQAQAMQAQQKRDEMIAAMVGGDEQAFAALYPEEYAKNQFEMQRDAAKQDPFVVNGQIVDRDTLEMSADFRDEQGPLSDAGKLFADANAGHLSPEQADARFRKMNEARGALVNVNTAKGGIEALTPFELKQDELYADALAQWNMGGGSDTLKNLTNLTGVVDRLEAGDENLTGWIIGNTPDWVLANLNPDALDAKDLVEEVVQRNLRIILGAQFTEKEGARLIARAYNARLPEAVNARRVRGLVQLIEGRAQQLQSLNEYVAANRTSAGWNGSLMSVDQMLEQLDEESGGANSPAKGQKRPRWNPDTQSFDE